MSNYICTARTNYFIVNDEEKYKEFFSNLVADEGEVYDLSKDVDGKLVHAFGAYGTIGYYNDDECGGYCDFDFMISEIMKLLDDDSVFAYFESGNEKLRFVDGFVCVCSNNNVESLNLDSFASDTILKMRNDKKSTKTFEDKPSDLISKIEAYSERKNAEVTLEKEREERELEALKETIRRLKPRIDRIIEVGNACLKHNIPLEGRAWGGRESYETHQFFTNSWSHLVGFVREKAGTICLLGINGGGACGEFDFRTNGGEIYDIRETTGLTREPSKYHLKKFVENFDTFEKSFYEYIDEITK